MHAVSALAAPATRRVHIVLCLAAFLAALNFYAPAPFYPEIARDLHTTVPLLGQVVTLMALLSASLGLIVGPLTDRYGFRWPLVIGLMAIAMGLIGTGLAMAFPVLLGLGVLMGLGDALVYSMPFAIAATRFRGAEQRQAIGWTMGALSIAPLVGVPVLTALGGLSSWRVALVLAGLIAVGAAWLAATVLPADSGRARTEFRLVSLREAYAPLLRHAPTLRLYGVSALRGLWWLGLITYLGAFLGTAVGLSPQQVGIVYALVGGSYAIGSTMAMGRLGRVPARTLVSISTLISGMLVGPMLMVSAPIIVVPLLLGASLASAICRAGVVSLLAAESPAAAGTTMLLNGSVINFGSAGGAIMGGALIALGGYGALGIGLPVCAAMAAMLAWWPARTSVST